MWNGPLVDWGIAPEPRKVRETGPSGYSREEIRSMRSEIIEYIRNGDGSRRKIYIGLDEEEVRVMTPEELLPYALLVHGLKYLDAYRKQFPPDPFRKEYEDKPPEIERNMLTTHIQGTRIILDIESGKITAYRPMGIRIAIADPEKTKKKFIEWLKRRAKQECDLEAQRVLRKLNPK